MRCILGWLVVAGCTSSELEADPGAADAAADPTEIVTDAGTSPGADAAASPGDASMPALDAGTDGDGDANVPPVDTTPGTLSTVQLAASNPGQLNMYEYVPTAMPAHAPLVVVLHGCTQTAADYVNAGWNALADLGKFYVVYAETTPTNNSARCFNWFQPADIARTGGEAESVAQMVTDSKSRHDVDASRVFVTGLSAGGAMTAVMLATYPDVFAAGGIMAGLPYECATNLGAAISCQGGNVSKTAAQWGDLVRSAAGAGASRPRVSIWQGSADQTVAAANAQSLVSQWNDVHGITGAAIVDANAGANVTHQSWANATGVTQVESWTIAGMGHGTALEPGLALANGCGTAGAYLLDVGVCSTYKTAQFFGLQ